MKLSVIVPIYNVEKYLKECVDSIVNSSYVNIEIILVDDGSKDNCGKICDEFAIKDKRIKVIHKENGGLVSARKAGAQIATGEYLTFVDGDDWIAPDWYEKVMKDLQKSGADIHISGLYEWRDGEARKVVNELRTGLYIKDERWEEIFSAVLCDERMKKACIPGIVVKILKTRLFQNNMEKVNNNIHNSEDALFSIVCMRSAECIQVNNTCLGYFYRIVDESMSHCYDEKYWKYTEAYCENLELLLKSDSSEKITKRIIADEIYMVLRYLDKELFYGIERNACSKINHLKRLLSESTRLEEALKLQKICDLQISIKGKMVILLLRYRFIYLLYFMKCLSKIVKREKSTKKITGYGDIGEPINVNVT